jgi:WD40 repeat protein
VFTLTGHTDWVTSIAVSADGTRIVSGSQDRFVKIWNAATGAEVGSFVGVRSLWSGDGGTFMLAFKAGFAFEVV